MAKIYILRLGHRVGRDKRVSTHIGLVARAFGADGVYYTGDKDEGLMNSVKKVVGDWGGPFKVEYVKEWRKFIKEWSGETIHLTFYGLPFQENLGKLNKKDKLIIVGGQKVPWDVYEMADWNFGVTNQPHSEIAAVAVLLDHMHNGKELKKEFQHAKTKIIPQACGKKVEHED